MTQFLSPEAALTFVKSDSSVFIHSAAATPQILVKAMVSKAPELKNVKIFSIHTEGNCEYADPIHSKSFKVYSFFNGANIRRARKDTNSVFVPIFLSEIPSLFSSGIYPIDVALIQVSPPDRHGMCSLGPSVDVSLSAIQAAKLVIAQVNPRMPRTFGQAQIRFSEIDIAVEVEEEIYIASKVEPTSEIVLIGNNIAQLIDDGSTLQVGIGSIPEATLGALRGHRNLGIHTEMFSDALVDLYRAGAITNKFKPSLAGKIVSSFVIGTRKVYDFIDDNPEIHLMDTTYTNDTHVIRQNPSMIAINSAIEVDLTGQVCADSIGAKIYSGVGGQMDFLRGAALSKGGKPIIALRAISKHGSSKIVAALKKGAGVTATRSHVHYVVTEYGVAKLFGKTLDQRVREMIRIAAPEFRVNLEREYYALSRT